MRIARRRLPLMMFAVLLASAWLATGCIVLLDEPRPVVYAPPPPPPPPPVYYAPSPPPGYYVPAPPPAVVIEGRAGGGQNPQHDRSRHVQANCNTVWTGCSNACNTNIDANQRAVCIANCNHARDLCVRKNLGY
ncbi:hypothetical protein [Fundidesulfovibrio terrae]|uniref:hypothetical protein n=1 Tax=Fundidesulfovibrio terrae TaxID=2922866 RepID=UPI001FB00381|nr:hypothetical protein [Fundidesulfovibrio terrae]